MLQRGLGRSSGLSGLSFWHSGIIAEEALTKAVSLVGSDQRAGVLQLTAFGARDHWHFVVLVCGAPRRQLKRRPLGARIETNRYHGEI